MVPVLDRPNIVNDGLLNAESDAARVMMLPLAEFVLRGRSHPHSELLSGNSLRKPSC